MFTNKMQLMLYVADVPAAIKFWQSLGFALIDQQEIDGTIVAEIAPSPQAEVHFMLYDKEFIETHSPEVALNFPSIMFTVENITELYKKMQEQSVEVGDLIQMEEQLVFNFADNEGNYFAVSGK